MVAAGMITIPAGMMMPGRKYELASKNYRYGFNGQEKSTEVNDNSYTAEFWQYDSRIGRRWNTDPITKVSLSPYSAFANNPLILADPNGADTVDIIRKTILDKRQQRDPAYSPGGLDNYPSRMIDPGNSGITKTGSIGIKAADGEDVFRITDISSTIDENGKESITSSVTTTLVLNNPQTFYRSGGHNMEGYIDDRYALAANAPDWLLKYYADKSNNIGVRSAVAYQKSVPFAYSLNKIMNVAYTVSGAYGLFRFGVSRLAFTSYINLANKQRTIHILAGDATGGGHSWFGSLKSFANGLTGSKSMFPASWSGNKIMHAISEVTVNNPWVQITGRAGAQFTKSGAPVRYAVQGSYEGVQIKVITTADDIITAFPIK